jgi:hypothetical protein
MSEQDNTPRAIELRIAAAQAARPSVDSQGRPKGKPTTYTYDATGKLVTAEPADNDD